MCPADLTAEIAVRADSNAEIAVAVVSVLVLVLAALVSIVVCLCRKRERKLPDDRDSGTDIEMVCIAQVNDGFTLAAIE